MTLMNSSTRYGLVARTLHWTMAILILAAYLVGDSVGHALHAGRSGSNAWVIGVHTGIGISLIGLLVVRILWRGVNKTPDEDPEAPTWELKAARWSHVALYTVMAVVPLSGLAFALTGHEPMAVSGLSWAGITQIPAFGWPTLVHRALGAFHEGMTSVLVAVVGLHVAATLWHSFIRRDGVAARMVPFAKT